MVDVEDLASQLLSIMRVAFSFWKPWLSSHTVRNGPCTEVWKDWKLAQDVCYWNDFKPVRWFVQADVSLLLKLIII